LRVYDIKDSLQPVESGWFIPPDPVANAGPLPKDVVTQTEGVLVDTRGDIYITDKNSGMRPPESLGQVKMPRCASTMVQSKIGTRLGGSGASSQSKIPAPCRSYPNV
jgi:hypothetical protein